MQAPPTPAITSDAHHIQPHGNDYQAHKEHVEQYAQMNTEYLKKRYRRKYENPSKIRELMNEQLTVIENLKTAIEGKMDLAVVGILQSILVALDTSNYEGSSSKASVDAGDRQRALFKANVCPCIHTILQNFIDKAPVCEKTLLTVAYLCRYSDENKASVCLENAKGLGTIGVCEQIVEVIKRHNNDKKVIIAACDAIRCLSSLESNRDRFGACGACEATARAIVKYGADAETIGWICRALGHLANNNENNRELMGAAGACQSVVMSLQKFPNNTLLCTEACWAIRQLAPTEDNRARFANDFAPESILAVYKSHVNNEAFIIEAVHALSNLIASEDDDIVPRIAAAGFIALTFRSLKKHSESEVFCRWVFQVLYYFACDDHMGPQLITAEVLKNLSDALQNHCTYEYMAEWGCRLVHKLIRFDDASERMRNAGINEMVTDAVQRQAISRVVSSVGCLALGDLARDKNNQNRLIESGACEAAVGALKRHLNSVDVAYNSCYAIHHLCMTQNNVSWMGANGACEAVTAALNKHTSTSEEVARFGANALGSLAYKDEGNQLRLFNAGGCAAIVNALTIHATSTDVVESTCRAIYNLCPESQNISELGKCGACGLVVAALQNHGDDADVVTQALYAIYGLAVKEKLDKVHKGNTRKLVDKGALEVIMTVMGTFGADEEVQRAGGMAIASLGRLEANRQRLGGNGACELVAKGLATHIGVSGTVAKLALAVDVLSTNSEVNKAKFTNLKVVDNLLTALSKHEKDASMVADVLRALITLSTVEAIKHKMFNEPTFRMFNKLMRMHEKNESVANWSCQMIYTASTTDENRVLMGVARACETTVAVLARHGEKNTHIAEWGCKAIVGLSLSDANKERFHNPESCAALVKVLQNHNSNAVVAEWCTAAIVSIAVFPQNRVKLGTSGACQAIYNTLIQQASSETIVKLVCEAVYELCKDITNQGTFRNVGIGETLVNVLQSHIYNAALSADVCRAIYGFCNNNGDNANKLADLGVCAILAQGLKQHLFSAPFCQWSSAAIAALTGPTNAKNQSAFGDMGVIEALARLLPQHQHISIVCAQATRALRGLTTSHRDNQKRVGRTNLPLQVLQFMRMHVNSEIVVEHSGWLLANIEYKPPRATTPTPSLGTTTAAATGATDEEDESSNNESTKSVGPPSLASFKGQASSENNDVVVDEDGKTVAAGPALIPATSFYTNTNNWDLLFATLQAHRQRRNSLKWICAAIAMFAERGKLSHGVMCDFLVQLLSDHAEYDSVVQKTLFAIGALARANVENNVRLSHQGHLFETLDQILAGYYEGSAVIYGVLPAITGLAEGQDDNKDALTALPHICTSVVKTLYGELETDLISQYGCAAIAALVEGHPKNQAKFSAVCNFIADVLTTHKRNVTISTEAVRAISFLAHKSITNRNKLGANDCCASILVPMNLFFEEHVNASWWKIEKTLMYWTVRAIGDLAANNPNNQAKLGHAGACELLINIMRQRKAVASEKEQESKLFAYVFWALGNLVQIGAKGAALDQILPKGDMNTSSGHHLPSPKGVNSASSENLDATLAAATAANAGNGGGRGLGNFGRQASQFVNNVAQVVGNTNSSKSMKNTSRFVQEGLSVMFPMVMRRYVDSPVTMLWACRAIVNLCKSQRLKMALLDESILGIVQGVVEKYRGPEGAADVLEWATMAQDVLVAPDE